MFKLSPRLQLIYDHLLPGKPVWDLCCDHGYLGLKALSSQQFLAVHFVDRAPHLISRIQLEISERGAEVATPCGFWGCAAENLYEPLEGTVVIAGVGAYTIRRILKELIRKNILKAQRLILCPQGRPEELQQELRNMEGFDFSLNPSSPEVVERGRIRKVLILEYNSQNATHYFLNNI